MRLGIGTYTLSWATGGREPVPADMLLSIPDIVAFAGTLPDVEVVQICDHSFPEKLSREERDDVRARAESLGLTVQIGTRGILPEHLLKFLEIAVEFKSDLLRTILPQQGPGATYSEAAALLRTVLPEFENAGVRLALENHDKNGSADLRRLVESVGSPVFGICLDSVNSYGIGEDSRRILDTLAPVTNCFHAKDYRIDRVRYNVGFSIVGTAAGDGMLDIPAILERFSRLGRSPDVILEHWTPPQESLAATIELEKTWTKTGAERLARMIRANRDCPIRSS